MTQPASTLHPEIFERLSGAAQDQSRVSGLTHGFYRYPARFSPKFAATAIEQLSEPGDLVLDPYMGGGTVIVEAAARGRLAVGNDINSLSTFLAKAKTTRLTVAEIEAVTYWALEVVPGLNYRASSAQSLDALASEKTKNLSLPRGRFIKKVLATALASIDELPSVNAAEFVRCAVLNVSQWALDGRKTHTSVEEFRRKLSKTTIEMIQGIKEFSSTVSQHKRLPKIILSNGNANAIDLLPIFAKQGRRAKLIVTSPPYPGVHVLYHRWQVDGRRETPAPYWITQRTDGQGSSYYCFGDRRSHESGAYFDTAFETLRSIRRVIADDGLMVQLIAFSNPKKQLPRYLEVMQLAGFSESLQLEARIWREVPNRKWHAHARGVTNSAREVLLVHTPA
ncbi:DNA methyltransferase [Lysobacter sp. M2-1]|uniref:DNA methyltransferase n=1 Tax=Lysobacter sp. M2-1 TaxID=2916839 RepID=UPI001F58275F|nr:DNA methyltransferase [Lysobacter sp. M2-1]